MGRGWVGLIFFVLIAASARASWDPDCPVSMRAQSPFARLAGLVPMLPLNDPYAQVDALGARLRTAAIYGREDRQIITEPIYPYRSMGRVTWPGGHCSASLISPCHIITAKHCMIDSSNQARPVSALVFNPVGGVPATTNVVAGYVGDDSSRSGDFAILKLDSSIGSTLGFMRIQYEEPASLENRKGFEASGYSADIVEGTKLSSDPTAEFLKTPRNVIGLRSEGAHVVEYRADTFLGASGGPIWRKNSAGEAVLVGLISSALTIQEPQTKKFVNYRAAADDPRGGYAVTSSGFIKEAQDWMKRNRCTLDQK
ncbi:MAG: trypsin-like serine peptidase [Bdellovibrio sp.]|jgi:V8-like Glu-specific endopeptidase